LSLEHIKEIISDGSVDRLLLFLEKQVQKSQEEIKGIEKRIKDMEWYIDYFTYMDKNRSSGYLYKVKIDTRYIITTPCYKGQDLSDMEISLAATKSRKDLCGLNYWRQYGYILDFDAFLHKIFEPSAYFVYLREKLDFDIDSYQILPAGEYLCFRGKLLTDEWEPNIITEYFKNRKQPALVLAMEYEDNLVEYNNAWYEVQILLK